MCYPKQMLSGRDSLLEDQKYINATARVSWKHTRSYSVGLTKFSRSASDLAIRLPKPTPLPPQPQRRRRRSPRRTPISSPIQKPTPKSIHPAHLPHEHVPSRFPHALPLLHQHRNLAPDVLNDKIRLDIVAVIAKGVFELGGDAVNAVQSEDNEDDDGDGPPAHFVDEGEGEDTTEEGEDLFLVNSGGIG